MMIRLFCLIFKISYYPIYMMLPVLSHPHQSNNINYIPSNMEEQWLQSPKRELICTTAATPEQIMGAKDWLSYSETSFRHPTPRLIPTEAQNLSLSFMDLGFGQYEPIEPLHGIGRHPFANVGCFQGRKRKKPIIPIESQVSSIPITSLMDLTYLILQNKCDNNEREEGNLKNGFHHHQSKNFFFDLGASSGFKGYEKEGGIPSKIPHTGSNIGGSLPLFYRLYKDRCQEFDEIFAWEVSEMSHLEWWSTLPPYIRAKVHYYNVPVNETNQLNGEINPASFLHLLSSVVTEHDNVIIKIDIDTPLLEFKIMETIANELMYTKLVDEIFFEYHYYYDGLNFGWGRNNKYHKNYPFSNLTLRQQTSHKNNMIKMTDDINSNHDVDSALKLFRTLREKGIRAHFWI